MEWDRDLDMDGSRAAQEGRSGPHIYIRSHKSDTPHWMPLHPVAVEALTAFRQEPKITPKVFDLAGRNPTYVSRAFARLCVQIGLTTTVTTDEGEPRLKNQWRLHDLRRRANTDLRNRGASPKERAALLGHRCISVNEKHYEAVLPERQRQRIDDLPVFEIPA